MSIFADKLKAIASFNEKVQSWEREALIKGGFNPDTLTKDQVYIILEPSDAPENYACDGEITQKQAASRWLKRCKEYGLSAEQIKKAIKMNFNQ